ncbi:MAG: DUF4340 domain-containing protein [Opitutae bacterium]|nr:DUF4340 domain-containing protein [Opitutae bacterium]
MRKQLTLILILMNLVVLAVFYLFEKGIRVEDRFALEDNKIFHEEAVNIDYIRISGDSIGPDRILKKTETQWDLTSPMEWQANIFAVSRILNQITFLEKETGFLVEELKDAERDLSNFGLDNPQLRLEFGKGAKRTAIAIGAPTEIGNRVYILSPDQKEIMVIKRGLYDSLLVDLGNLQSQSVFEIPLFELKTLSIQKSYPSPLRIRILKIDHQWRFETPIQTRADLAEVETVVNGLNNLAVHSFIDNPDPDPSIYNLTNPQMRLTLEAEDKRQSILIGAKYTEEGGDEYYYAKLSESDTVFTVPVRLFDEHLNNAQEILRERRFVPFDPNAISALEISRGNRALSLQKLETGVWQVFSREEDGSMVAHAADPAIVAAMVTSLQTLRAQIFVSDAPSKADLEVYGFTDPQRVIQLQADRDIVLEVGDLVAGNPRHAYAKLKSEPFIYEVDRSLLEEFHTRPLDYRARLVHREPTEARLVGLTIYEADADQVVYGAALNEETPTWASIAEEFAVESAAREDLLSLVDQARMIEAKSYIDEAFDSIEWKYRLDFQFERRGEAEVDSWTTSLWVSERFSGTRTIVGFRPQERVFYAPQRFIDAFFGLTISRADPGPEPEPATPRGEHSVGPPPPDAPPGP